MEMPCILVGAEKENGGNRMRITIYIFWQEFSVSVENTFGILSYENVLDN